MFVYLGFCFARALVIIKLSEVRLYGNICIQEYIEHCRSLYKQLVEEVPLEKFDERRVNLLKSQVIQLERQVRHSVALKFKVISSTMVSYYRYSFYNNQINACAVIGQSAVGYCAGKPTEKSLVF